MQLIEPSFGSNLTRLVMVLNHLREKRLSGSTHPLLFFQLKEIFHIMESVGSARLEGNHTTVAEYVNVSLNDANYEDDNIRQIRNIEKALEFIEDNIDSITIDNRFIRELHAIVVDGLSVGNGGEGDATPVSYRTENVNITMSEHRPPDHVAVHSHMNELVDFINHEDPPQYDLIKVAMAHHRFVWIHPFKNGNGRTVRLLTYAMLAKAGFQVVKGRLINPAAVFFADRELYINMLEHADHNTEAALETWCEYVLNGLRDEIEKIDRLTDHEYLYEKILLPAIKLSYERSNITHNEYIAMKVAAEKIVIKAADIIEATGLARPTVSNLVRQLRNKGLLMAETEGGRQYVLQMRGRELWKSIYVVLKDEGFINE